ncbi:unnamed protein product [Chrysoparadoxa australica]
MSALVRVGRPKQGGKKVHHRSHFLQKSFDTACRDYPGQAALTGLGALTCGCYMISKAAESVGGAGRRRPQGVTALQPFKQTARRLKHILLRSAREQPMGKAEASQAEMEVEVEAEAETIEEAEARIKAVAEAKAAADAAIKAEADKVLADLKAKVEAGAAPKPEVVAANAVRDKLLDAVIAGVKEWDRQYGSGAQSPRSTFDFKPSELPAALIAEVDAASEELRLAVFSKLFSMTGKWRFYLNLPVARLLRKASLLLVPVDGPNAVSYEARAKEMVAAVRQVAHEIPGLSDSDAAKQAGWLLWLLEFVERDLYTKEEEATQLPLGQQAVGMAYDFLVDSEQEDLRRAKSSKMFAAEMKTLLLASGAFLGVKLADVEAQRMKISESISYLYKELRPTPDDGVTWLRARGRDCLGDMVRRSNTLMSVEGGYSTDAKTLEMVAEESLTGMELLQSTLTLALTFLTYIIYWNDGLMTMTPKRAITVSENHMKNASKLTNARGLYTNFMCVYINGYLTGERSVEEPGKFDSIVLRRLISMLPDSAWKVHKEVYPEALGRALHEAITSGRQALPEGVPANVVSQLDTLLELTEDQAMTVKKMALQSYARLAMESGSGSGAGTELTSSNPDTAWVCGYLGVSPELFADAVEHERLETFEVELTTMLAREGADRYEPLASDGLAKLKAVFEDGKLGYATAREGAVDVLTPLLLELIAFVAEAMKRKDEAAGIAGLQKICATLDGLCTQLLGAFKCSEEEVIDTVCLKGKVPEDDQFWLSELTWDMIDACSGETGLEEETGEVIEDRFAEMDMTDWEDQANKVRQSQSHSS